MSDQGFYQRNINTGGGASQSFDLIAVTNSIGSSTTVVAVDTTAGDVGVTLPEQVSSAGSRISVVNTTGANFVRIFPLGTDLINGVNASLPVAAGPYASATLVSLGSGGWAVT